MRTTDGAAQAASVIPAARATLAAPAFAPVQKCTGQTVSNVCLRITQVDTDLYQVHLGIDFHISQQTAQEIINAPGDPFLARIFGVAREPIGNNALFVVPETVIVATAESGLSADFDIMATRAQLNKDNYDWPFQNTKIFGRIILTQASGGPSLTFDSPQFPQNF